MNNWEMFLPGPENRSTALDRSRWSREDWKNKLLFSINKRILSREKIYIMQQCSAGQQEVLFAN